MSVSSSCEVNDWLSGLAKFIYMQNLSATRWIIIWNYSKKWFFNALLHYCIQVPNKVWLWLGSMPVHCDNSSLSWIYSMIFFNFQYLYVYPNLLITLLVVCRYLPTINMSTSASFSRLLGVITIHHRFLPYLRRKPQ